MSWPSNAELPTAILDELRGIWEENRLLREEVQELGEAMLLLEHKLPSLLVEDCANQYWEKASKPRLFADLLAGFEPAG